MLVHSNRRELELHFMIPFNLHVQHIDPESFCFFQVVVLWVGTNNHGHTAEQICGGIMAIVQVIKNKLPNAQTLVLVGFFAMQVLNGSVIDRLACV